MKKNKRFSRFFREYGYCCYIVLVFLSIILTSLIQMYIYIVFNLRLQVLEGDFIDIYSLVIGVISLFCIYFAFFQYLLEVKGRQESYLGIKYASVVINSSPIFKYGKSVHLFGLLFLFSIFPIGYKMFTSELWKNFISFSWLSMLITIISLFIFILFSSLRKIDEVIDNPYSEKLEYCLEKSKELYREFVAGNNSSSYGLSDLETIKLLIDYYSNQLKNIDHKFEKQFYLNGILDEDTFEQLLSNQENLNFFIEKYIELLIKNNISLLAFRNEKPIFLSINFRYSILFYPILNFILVFQNKITDRLVEMSYVKQLLNLFQNDKDINASVLTHFFLSFLNYLSEKDIDTFLNVIKGADNFEMRDLIYQLSQNGVDIFLKHNFKDDDFYTKRELKLIYTWGKIFNWKIYDSPFVKLN